MKDALSSALAALIATVVLFVLQLLLFKEKMSHTESLLLYMIMYYGTLNIKSTNPK